MSASFVVGAMVASAVAVVARPRPALPRRVAELRGPSETPSSGLVSGTELVAVPLGRLVRRVLRRAPDRLADRRTGAAILVAAVLLLVHPAVAVAAAAVLTARPRLVRRRADRRCARQLRDAVPDLVDLFRFAAAAGLTVRLAVDAVAARAVGPVAAPLQEVRRRVALGERLADAVGDVLPAAGEPLRPLAAVLVHAERDGVGLAPSLERIADDARAERRRAAEEEARRIPVRLLFPLVGCILPAFVLLTIVPLLVGSFSSLPLRPS